MNPPQSSTSATPAQARRVLVLQGGGALGSYQAGAYQALCRHDFEPAWIAGISIGAINAAATFQLGLLNGSAVLQSTP